jgi:ribulose-phosphate 3-epimerase
MPNNIISASILSADFSALGAAIHQCESAGVDWIHIDVMDGHFVPNITMGPFIVETCKRITSLPLDVHLMIDNSEKYVEAFIKAGASNVSIHIENNLNIVDTLQTIRSMGAHPGVVLNPETPASAIENVLPFVDMVLVMTVHPGFSGQKFMPQEVAKISEVHKMLCSIDHNVRLEVDGGISADTIRQCADAGADTFVTASAIFKHQNGITSGVNELRFALK